jgi:hypothetical protein
MYSLCLAFIIASLRGFSRKSTGLQEIPHFLGIEYPMLLESPHLYFSVAAHVAVDIGDQSGGKKLRSHTWKLSLLSLCRIILFLRRLVHSKAVTG